MATQHTFPQDGDFDYAANFGQLLGLDNLTSYVESGMDFTYDSGIPDVTISTGHARIKVASATISDISEDRLDVGYAVQVNQQTVSLTDSAVNSIYVEPALGTDDSATYEAYTNESNAGANALKIGEIDTGADTTTTLNREPDITVFDLFVNGVTEVTGDIVDAGGTTIWDASATEIPDGAMGSISNTTLANSSITVNANNGLSAGTVSLGGTVTIGINGTLTLDSDLEAINGETIWDESQSEIPDSAMGTISTSTLSANSITVAGNTVSLGGSTGIALGDLSNVTASGEGSGNGFNADQVDGQDATDITKSEAQVQTESAIWSSGYAPRFGGQ